MGFLLIQWQSGINCQKKKKSGSHYKIFASFVCKIFLSFVLLQNHEKQRITCFRIFVQNKPLPMGQQISVCCCIFPKVQSFKDLPPIVIVIQNIVNADFMEDLIKYSLSLYEEHKTLPIILVFLIEGFSDEEINQNSR